MDYTKRRNTLVIHDVARDAWLPFSKPLRILQATQQDMVLEVLKEVDERTRSKGLSATGFVPYGAAPAFDPAPAVRPSSGFPPAWFGIYCKYN